MIIEIFLSIWGQRKGSNNRYMEKWELMDIPYKISVREMKGNNDSEVSNIMLIHYILMTDLMKD